MTIPEMRRELERATRMPRDSEEIRRWYHECPREVRVLVDGHQGTIREGARAALKEFHR